MQKQYTTKYVGFVSELNPTPSEEICQSFNELRSDMVLLMEIKAALSTCEFELQSLRHQYEALNPGKVVYEVILWSVKCL